MRPGVDCKVHARGRRSLRDAQTPSFYLTSARMASSEHNAVGELELSKLLSSLNPILDPELYVFVTLPPGTTPPGDLVVQMLFREREGMTVITTKESAIKHDFSFTFQSRMITLDVHSSLEAVGFIAKITEELTKLRIGVNPVSGYFHDHLFIADGKEEEVLAALDKIKQKAMAESGPMLPPS
ncbi:hypothetical protein, variant [Verruconis gallopava]|uniref:DUF2241 domain-containing protein n=1 Tax=Verruconis gallopava TaxID=253628 RepID=A0A0D2A924_9PEZI|nr:hypothetical protein, variant [Verruconis gallopava]KIW03268.1 hypothetical protein, variant [Verruconis gallopava]